MRKLTKANKVFLVFALTLLLSANPLNTVSACKGTTANYTKDTKKSYNYKQPVFSAYRTKDSVWSANTRIEANLVVGVSIYYQVGFATSCSANTKNKSEASGGFKYTKSNKSETKKILLPKLIMKSK